MHLNERVASRQPSSKTRSSIDIATARIREASRAVRAMKHFRPFVSLFL